MRFSSYVHKILKISGDFYIVTLLIRSTHTAKDALSEQVNQLSKQ